MLSVPDGRALEEAFGSLDLLVSIDLYVNETAQHADYVLPATTFLERADVPVAFMPFFVKPFAQWTDAVVAPRGEARPEWEVIDDIATADRRRAVQRPAAAVARRLGVRMTPDRLVDVLLRRGPRRLSLGELKRSPHGMLLDEHHETGGCRSASRREAVARPAGDLARDRVARRGPAPDPSLPLRLIGMRELRSHNSWMHNVEKLMRARDGQLLRIHPADAASRGLADGDLVSLRSASGAVTACRCWSPTT